VPELSLELEEPFMGADLIINLRAEAPSEKLAAVLEEALTEIREQCVAFGLQATLQHLEHFQPGKPTPTHRDV